MTDHTRDGDSLDDTREGDTRDGEAHHSEARADDTRDGYPRAGDTDGDTRNNARDGDTRNNARDGDARAHDSREVNTRDGDTREMGLTLLTVLGLVVAMFSRFAVTLPSGVVSGALILAYLAGGVPAGTQALRELFGKFRLDIDLLMVVAALAAASVGAVLEGAVLLALFSLSGTAEHRALGKARRAVEALMALRPESALRLGMAGVDKVAGNHDVAGIEGLPCVEEVAGRRKGCRARSCRR